MTELLPRHKEILRSISEKAYIKYGKGLTKKIKKYADVKFIAEKTIEHPDTPEETRKKFQMILDAGYLDKEYEIVDSKVQKKLEKEIDKQIKYHIKLGLLPPLPDNTTTYEQGTN